MTRAAAENFDYAALTVDYVMDIGEEQFLLQKNLFNQCRLAPEICFSILPRDIVITKKGFNLYLWVNYLKKAIYRLSELGCQKMIWGDGNARTLPLEIGQSEMKEQALQFIYMLCQSCENYNIKVLIEPISPCRTNYLNSMQEIREFIAIIKKDNLSSALSLRELDGIGFALEHFADAADMVQHVHLENPLNTDDKRLSPRPGDGYNYRPFYPPCVAFVITALLRFLMTPMPIVCNIVKKTFG